MAQSTSSLEGLSKIQKKVLNYYRRCTQRTLGMDMKKWKDYLISSFKIILYDKMFYQI